MSSICFYRGHNDTEKLESCIFYVLYTLFRDTAFLFFSIVKLINWRVGEGKREAERERQREREKMRRRENKCQVKIAKKEIK